MGSVHGENTTFLEKLFFFTFSCFSGSTDPESMFWIKRNSFIDEACEISFQELVHGEMASYREKKPSLILVLDILILLIKGSCD